MAEPVGSAEPDAQDRAHVPDPGTVSAVAGAAPGLLREVSQMSDGRRITYYRLAAPGAGSGSGS